MWIECDRVVHEQPTWQVATSACRRFEGLWAWSRRGAAAHRGGLHRRADGADVRHRRARQLAAGEEAKSGGRSEEHCEEAAVCVLSELESG